MTGQHRPVAVLVDSYTTGNHLPPAFARLDADVVHVRSTPELLTSMVGPDLSLYRADAGYGTAIELAARLGEFRPVAVLAGQEPGVPLADELSELLGLAGNGTALSSARRDKYDMIEALRRADVRCADQLRTDDPARVLAWCRERGEYPVVVKPLNSAATDGVEICADEQQVAAAVAAILGSKTIYEELNREVLVQSFLAGEEYVVDMVSVDGHRYTCGVWRYQKRLIGTHNLYDLEVVLDHTDPLVDALIEYVDSALTALGIIQGATHAEVIVTPQGPTLVEVGARLGGNMHPAFHDIVLGGNQADMTALAYIRPQEFLERFGDHRYTKRREAAVYTAPTTLDGTVASIDQAIVEKIEGLDSVFGVNVKIKPGSRIRPTVDLYTSTLRVFLNAATRAEVDRDHRQIEAIKDSVFVLEA
jgi:hypothetical protein